MTEAKTETQTDYRVGTCAPADVSAADMERCATLVIEGEAIENLDSVKRWLGLSCSRSRAQG